MSYRSYKEDNTCCHSKDVAEDNTASACVLLVCYRLWTRGWLIVSCLSGVHEDLKPRRLHSSRSLI